MELKIPQLTLAKIAQMGKHETVNIRSEHYSSRVEGSTPVVLANTDAKFILIHFLVRYPVHKSCSREEW